MAVKTEGSTGLHPDCLGMVAVNVYVCNQLNSQFCVYIRTPETKHSSAVVFLSQSVYFNGHFSRWTWVSRYQDVSILDFIGTMDDGGGDDSWSYKARKAPVKASSSTNQHPTFLQAGCPFRRPTNSVRTVKGNLWQSSECCSTVYWMT